jgi:hypothetical protein
MREMTVLAIIAAMGLGMLQAHAQTTPGPQPRPAPPAQSAQPTSTSGRALPQAPTGHRQPRASDVPNEDQIRVGPGDIDLDQLKICRGC